MRLIDADAVKAMIYERIPLNLFMMRTIEGAQQSMGELRGMIDELPTIEAEPVVRCKDCRHFSVKDYWGNINGVPILGASDVPTCDAWANTECMVNPDGYCFLAERRADGEQ